MDLSTLHFIFVGFAKKFHIQAWILQCIHMDSLPNMNFSSSKKFLIYTTPIFQSTWNFHYILFPLALKSLVVIPILSKYWFSKQFPFDCQCVFMTRLKSVFLRSNKSESHEAALKLIRLAIYSLNCLVWFEDQ